MKELGGWRATSRPSLSAQPAPILRKSASSKSSKFWSESASFGVWRLLKVAKISRFPSCFQTLLRRPSVECETPTRSCSCLRPTCRSLLMATPPVRFLSHHPETIPHWVGAEMIGENWSPACWKNTNGRNSTWELAWGLISVSPSTRQRAGNASLKIT